MPSRWLPFLLIVCLAGLAPAAPADDDPDVTPPVVDVNAPLPHNWYRAPFQAWVEATDAPHDDNIDWVRIQAAGLPAEHSFAAPHRFAIDVTQIGDGLHTFNATAADRAGNTRTVSQTFRVDQTAPTVTLTSHADRDIILAQTTLRANATDATSGVMRVAFYVGDTYIGARASPPYEIDWTPYLKVGHQQISAVATDRAGNTMRDSAMVLVL